MATDSQHLTKLQAQFQQLASSAYEASAQLERGQAEAPFSSAFQQMLKSESDQPLHVAIVSCDSTAKDRVVRWLNLSDPTGLELTIKLLNNHAWRNVQVTYASNFDQLQSQPQLYQLFWSQGHLLIVVAGEEYELDESAEAFLSDVTESFEVVWPTVVGTQKDANPEAWWNSPIFRTHSQRIEPFFLQSEETRSGGEVLTDAANQASSNASRSRSICCSDSRFGAIDQLRSHAGRTVKRTNPSAPAGPSLRP